MTKTVPTLAEVMAAISEHWKDVPAGAAAVHFIDYIQAKQSPMTEWRWHDLLRVFGNAATPTEIIGAMAILSQSEHSIFRACAEFVDEDGHRHRLSGEEFQRAQDTDTLTHPVTQAVVTRASERVVPIFELTTA